MKLKLILLSYIILFSSCAQNDNTNAVGNRIDEEQFIKINGIEQWVTIKGDNTKPLVLFLHGGPGNPLSPFADAIYEKWEKDFLLVQWDQRGAGKTFGRNAPEELTAEYMKSTPLTLEQMTADGIELVQYLIYHLKKKKIILLGTSWGSVLGVKMAQKKPELFYAYIGDSQVVDPIAAELFAYEKVKKLAKNKSDQKSLEILNQIGKPPYESARNTGQLNRIIREYEQKKSIPPPPSWFKTNPKYDNKKDNQDRFNGDDYSFVYYNGDKNLGISSLRSALNFLKDGLVCKIPVFFIQGKEDIQTPEVITKEYYNLLQAPEKKLISVPNAAHGFNQAVIDAQYEILKQLKIPVAGKN